MRVRWMAMLAAGWLGWCASAQGADFIPVALSGQQAPGTRAGTTFVKFAPLDFIPSMGPAGHVAFRATLAGPDVNRINDEGLWSGLPGAISLVYRDGDPAPGTDGGAFDIIASVTGGAVPNASGDVLFFAFASNVQLGLWNKLYGAVALGGMPAPAPYSDFTFTNFQAPAFNSSGQVAFNGTLSSPLGVSIWAGSPGAIQAVAVAGRPATGMGSGVNYFDVGLPVLNEQGQIAFEARVEGNGIVSTNDKAIWTGMPGSVVILSRAGDVAPAPGGTGRFGPWMGQPHINSTGQVLFNSGLIVDGAPQPEWAVWAGRSGSLRLVEQQNGPVPGLPPDVSFNELIWSAIDDEGRVGLEGSIQGPGIPVNQVGLWAERGGSLRLLAREGDPAPGLPNGVRLGLFSRLDPIMDRGGDIIFGAALTGPSVDASNDAAYYIAGATGSLRLLLRLGDLNEVGPEDLRTVNGIDILFNGNGGGDGLATCISASGDVAMVLSFTDGSSGIFVAVVPEPGVALVAVGLAAVVSSRRRR